MWPFLDLLNVCLLLQRMDEKQSAAVVNERLKGPKTVTFSGWRRCDVWGGIVRRVMPFSLAKSTEANKVCYSWLFKISKLGCSWEQREYFLMCSRYVGKMSSFIHPVLKATPVDPLGARLKKWFINLTRGKINIWGRTFPCAFTVYTSVTNSSRSLEVIARGQPGAVQAISTINRLI